MDRREFLKAGSALALLSGPVSAFAMRGAKVVVIGGGYGGATAAKYIRLLSGHTLDVTLVEPDKEFISCPLSNLVVGGSRKLADISRPYATLSKHHGITMVHELATSIDTKSRIIKLSGGSTLSYDKLVLSPGIDLNMGSIEGLTEAKASGQILQAWKAGPETLALRRQLESMPDGGV